MPSFEDLREGPAAPAWVKWAILAFLAGALLAGCAAAPYRPGLPHPSPDEISALARTAPARQAPEAPFQVIVAPPIVLSGGAAWIRCLVPQSYQPGRILLGLDGIFATEKPLDSIETKRLADHLPCGNYVAVCTIRTARGIEHREAKLEVRGEACDSSQE